MQFPPLSLIILTEIGLDKLGIRAKGIHHPKHAVKPACACSTHESASPVSHFTCEGKRDEGNGVTKGLAEPYADRRLFSALPVDMAAD